MTDETLDLDNLEQVARAALEDKPHGQPWETHEGGYARLIKCANPWNKHVAAASEETYALHIATFDPPTILRLIALARASVAEGDQEVSSSCAARLDAQSAPAGKPGQAGGREPADCVYRLGCTYHRMETEPASDLWFCSEPGCPHALVAAGLLP